MTALCSPATHAGGDPPDAKPAPLYRMRTHVSPTARRDGTPDRNRGNKPKKAGDYYVSQARPARHQHVERNRGGGGNDGEGVRLQKVLAQALSLIHISEPTRPY